METNKYEKEDDKKCEWFKSYYVVWKQHPRIHIYVILPV